MRLHKYIAACGYTSRRRAELLIQAGRVLVNGKSLMSLGTTVKQGDVVVFGKYSGTEIEIKGVTHLIVRESELLGMVEG